MSAVLKWQIASAGRSFSTAVPEQLRLLPLLFKVKHTVLVLSPQNILFLIIFYLYILCLCVSHCVSYCVCFSSNCLPS